MLTPFFILVSLLFIIENTETTITIINKIDARVIALICIPFFIFDGESEEESSFSCSGTNNWLSFSWLLLLFSFIFLNCLHLVFDLPF